MSFYKDTNITNPGTSIKYGADDMEIISRLFNGVTTGVGGPTIKTTSKWGFWDNILYVRNQADTFNTTIRGAVTQTANRDLALPNLTANDTLAAIGVVNVWSVRQQLEAGTLLKQMSAPSNPASTYHHLYVNASGQLVKRNSTGAETIYDAIGTGSAAALRDYSARVFNTGGTYFASDSSGNVISQGSVFETVAQAALNQKGSVLFTGPTTLAASGSFSGLDVDEKTHVIVERGCTITVPQGYTGHCFRILDKERSIISCYGQIEEAGTPARNWTGVFVDAVSMAMMNIHVIHLHVKNASIALRLRATGASAKIMGNSFHAINATDCRKTVTFEEATGGSIDMNMFMDNVTNALAGITTHGYNNVTGDMNEFYGCMFMDNSGTMVEMNIQSTANNTAIIGGNIGMMGGSTFVDASLTTVTLNAALALKIDSGFLKIKNPAGNQVTNIVNAAQTGTFNLTIPALTANDTLATLGLANTFTGGLQTIKRATSGDMLSLFRDTSVNGDTMRILFQGKDSGGATETYARIQGEIQDSTAGSEDGSLRFYVSIAGAITNLATLDNNRLDLLRRLRVTDDAIGEVLTLRHNSQTVGAAIEFVGDDSTNADTVYAYIASGINDPTNGVEDGAFGVDCRSQGNLLNMLWIDDSGLYISQTGSNFIGLKNDLLTADRDFQFPNVAGTLLVNTSPSPQLTAPLTITDTGGNDDILYLFNDINTNGESVQLNFDLDNSVGTRLSYCDFATSIIDNTSTSEDGRFSIRIVKAGTKVEMFRIENSITSLYNDITSANGTNTQLNFMARDSTAAEHVFAAIRSEVVDNVNATEDGKIEFLVSQNGTLVEAMTLTETGELDIAGGGLECKDDGAADLLDLYRTDNVATNSVNINFYLEDSTNAKTLYARILGEIVSNTNGSEDGRLAFAVRTDDVLTERMILNDTGKLDITSKSTETELLALYRDSGTSGNTCDIAFYLEDSAANKTNYSRIFCQIEDNTNGNEDGMIQIANMTAGTLRNSHIFYNRGHVDLYNFDNAVDSYNAIAFFLNDSASNRTAYAEIKGAIEDATNGSEDGYMAFSTVRAGTFNRVATLFNDGRLTVGRDSANQRPIVTTVFDTTNDVTFNTSTAENTLISYTVKGGIMGIDAHLRMNIRGIILQNQATGTTFTFRIKVGGTTVYQDTFGGTIAQSANTRPWMLDMIFHPDNESTTNGRMYGLAMMNDGSGLPTTGEGRIDDDEGQVMANFKSNSFAWTFANDTTISVTCQMSVSNVNTEVRMDGCYVEHHYS